MPAIGDEAPDFTLPSALHGQIGSVSLSQYRREKSVVLAFYVLDWTGT
jgi:peroxiredoxin